MSTTSNAQDLLVNVFRPAYRWDSNAGFVPSLVVSNVSEIITGNLKTNTLAVSDAGVNTYIGDGAGSITFNTASNVAIGFGAMGSASNSSNNVAIGISNFVGVSNSSSNVSLGANTSLQRNGGKNVLIGPNVNLTDGSYNILIGSDISAGSASYKFQIARLLYGDMSLGKLGIGTAAPAVALDVSGLTVFRNKVGIQTETPVYSLDVNGSVSASDKFIAASGSVSAPAYRFSNDASAGLYLTSTSVMNVATAGLNRMTFSNGNVGIGRTPTTYTLEVNGDASKTTSGTWQTNSDRRVKTDIELADTSLCYSVVKNLHLKRFTWDASYHPCIPDRRVVGWIAQDVEEVFPGAVTKVSEFGFEDFRYLDADQIFKTMYGALEKVIADKEAVETKLTQVLARLTALEAAAGLSSEASPQSSELTPSTPPTPPTPSESVPPESQPEPQPQSSSEYAPAPEATEA